MRILYTHRTQAVGAEGAHVLGMYEAFAELGHEVEMDCLPGCNPAVTGSAGGESGPPTRTTKLIRAVAGRCPQALFECLELIYNGPLFLRLARRYMRFKPDLIYERYALNTFAASMLCRLTGCQHVLEVNDSVVIERSRPLIASSIAAFWEGFCLRSAGLAITITHQFKGLLVERFGIAHQRILVLPNAVSRSRFDRPIDRHGMRSRLSLADRMVIGAAGQFLPWHGLESLVVEVAAGVLERNLHFLFIGDGPVREAVNAKAESLGILDRVTFTGMVPIEQVPDYLACVDIAVIPSAAPHASPMKLMEYMAAGLPIVAPDLPSIRATTGDSHAVLFPPGDVQAMRQAIWRVLDDRSASLAMGRRAREHALTDLTWTAHAQTILAHLGRADTSEPDDAAARLTDR